MKRWLLRGLIVFALLGLAGCMVISCEEDRWPPDRHVAHMRPCPVVEEIHILHP